MKLNIKNETSRLRAVVFGRADTMVDLAALIQGYNKSQLEEVIDKCYDPKSIEHIKAGTYPKKSDMIAEMDAVLKVFEKYNVKVYRPEPLEGDNQIFSRDVAFVIDDKLVKSNMIKDRAIEYVAIVNPVVSKIIPENVIELPEDCEVEGGDVMPWNDYLFIGVYSKDDFKDCKVARTNPKAVAELAKLFPNRKVKSFELKKNFNNAKENALHLDCCFQPIGKNMAIIHKDGFVIESEYQWLVDFFGKENVFEITKDEMYAMNSNIFSISETVIISEQNFTRLNSWLRTKGFTVEEVPYAEIAKQEGLLRCSTMPLVRD